MRHIWDNGTMNLSARTARDLRRFRAAGLAYGIGLAVVAGALEVVGRYTVNDLQDLGALLVLAVVAALIGLRHRRAPVPWVSGGLAAMKRAVLTAGRGLFEIGIDLRG